MPPSSPSNSAAPVSLDAATFVQLQRQAHLGAVAAALVHEFSNLASPTMMRAELALETGGAEDLKKSAQSTLKNTQRALLLCSSLMQLLFGDAVEQERVPWSEIVGDAMLAMARPLEKDRIVLQMRVPEGWAVRGNRILLTQMLCHLLVEIKEAARGAPARLRIDSQSPDRLDFETTAEALTPDFVETEWAAWLDTSRELPPLIQSPRELPRRACRIIAAAHAIDISVATRLPSSGMIGLVFRPLS